MPHDIPVSIKHHEPELLFQGLRLEPARGLEPLVLFYFFFFCGGFCEGGDGEGGDGGVATVTARVVTVMAATVGASTVRVRR